MRAKLKSGGFSLIEMLVVLVIIGLVMGLVGTGLSRSISGAEVRTAAKSLMAAIRHTRGQAIVKRTEMTLEIDTEKRTYIAPQRSAVELPDGMEVTLLTAESELTGENSGTIRFFPDGSSTGGTVTLRAGERSWEVTVAWLTGEVSLQ